MVDVVQSLEEFLEAAERNRKYAPNTAYGIKAALKIFVQELTSEERESLDLFKERLDKIYQNVYNKNKTKVSAASLELYKWRLTKFLNDYQNYGIDPSKMVNWNPQRRMRIKKDKVKQVPSQSNPLIEETSALPVMNVAEQTSFRPSKNVFISYPLDFTLEEAKSIQSFAGYLISMRSGEQTREK